MDQQVYRVFQDSPLERARLLEGMVKFYLATQFEPHCTPLPQSIRGLEKLYKVWQEKPEYQEAFLQSNAYLQRLPNKMQDQLLQNLETLLSWIKDEELLEELSGLGSHLSRSTSPFDQKLAIFLSRLY